MKPQVVTIIASASAGSGVLSDHASASLPNISSLSTRFLEQPSDTMPTVFINSIISFPF